MSIEVRLLQVAMAAQPEQRIQPPYKEEKLNVSEVVSDSVLLVMLLHSNYGLVSFHNSELKQILAY